VLPMVPLPNEAMASAIRASTCKMKGTMFIL
jgi:hypothetical protein